MSEENDKKIETTETSSEPVVIQLSKGDTPDFKWYVINAFSGHEHKVCKTLKERILKSGLTEYFSEILIPEESVITQRSGKKVSIKRKFFPGYIMLKMIMNDKTWHLIKSTDKVSGFVGGDKVKPVPIPEEEALFMLQQAAGKVEKSKSSVKFSEGETVKVIEGPFASFVGTVENVNDKGKIRVQVSIFGRPTPVELDFSQVEKV